MFSGSVDFPWVLGGFGWLGLVVVWVDFLVWALVLAVVLAGYFLMWLVALVVTCSGLGNAD